MPSGREAGLLLSGGIALVNMSGVMSLDSVELVHLATFKLELERLETVTSDKEDIEYQVVTRWLRNRVREIERR